MRITIKLAKDVLANYAPDEATLVHRLNLVSEELLNRMAHKGTQQRAAFIVQSDTLTLPWQYSGCVGMCWSDIPVRILNQWWEMLPNGPGIQDQVWREGVDLGDDYVVFKDLADVEASGCYLKVISDVAEDESPTIRFKGLDINSEEMRTEDADEGHIWGENVVIGDTGEWTANKFLTLTQVIKPKTNGRVRVYASATSGGTATLVAIYQPDETNPSWRRYKVPVNSDGTSATIQALCQLRHQWIENDDAELPIGHMGALIDGLRALHQKDQDDYTGYDKLMGDAEKKLNEEHRRYHPASTFQTIVQVDEPHHIEAML